MISILLMPRETTVLLAIKQLKRPMITMYRESLSETNLVSLEKSLLFLKSSARKCLVDTVKWRMQSSYCCLFYS